MAEGDGMTTTTIDELQERVRKLEAENTRLDRALRREARVNAGYHYYLLHREEIIAWEVERGKEHSAERWVAKASQEAAFQSISKERQLNKLLIGGTDLDYEDLPKGYIDLVREYQSFRRLIAEKRGKRTRRIGHQPMEVDVK